MSNITIPTQNVGHVRPHGKNPKYLDANYAGTLIIWDRMLGTFVAEDEKDLPDYGLVDPFDS